MSKIPDSPAGSPEGSEARFFVTVVSVGEAGLAQRPAVIERGGWPNGDARTVKIFRSGQEHLADALAAKLCSEAVDAAAGKDGER